MDVARHERRVVGHARADDAVRHDGFLDRVDVREVGAGDVPLDAARVVVVVALGVPQRRGRVRLAVDVPDGALAPAEVRRGHHVVAALVHDEPAARRRDDVVVVVLVEPVPPVEVVLREVRLTRLAGRGPRPGHEQVAFDGGHGAVGPARASRLGLDRGDVVRPADVPEIVRARADWRAPPPPTARTQAPARTAGATTESRRFIAGLLPLMNDICFHYTTGQTAGQEGLRLGRLCRSAVRSRMRVTRARVDRR